MYVHAGNNRLIMQKSIIGIFDLDSSSRGADTKNFLRAAEKEGRVDSAADELPKSFILEDCGKGKILLCQLSVSALLRRTGTNRF